MKNICYIFGRWGQTKWIKPFGSQNTTITGRPEPSSVPIPGFNCPWEPIQHRSVAVMVANFYLCLTRFMTIE